MWNTRYVNEFFKSDLVSYYKLWKAENYHIQPVILLKSYLGEYTYIYLDYIKMLYKYLQVCISYEIIFLSRIRYMIKSINEL